MGDDDSISIWLDRLKAGDERAAQQIWNRYFEQLVGLAYRRLRGTARAAADEEDVALSAFGSFFRAAEQGRFPKLNDRDDLWKLLVVITERKALNLVRAQGRLKRGGHLEHTGDLANLPGPEPTPLFAAAVMDEYRRLLQVLDDELLRHIAVDKMEGFGNEEIAARRGVALRSVERKLALIRRVWEQAAE